MHKIKLIAILQIALFTLPNLLPAQDERIVQKAEAKEDTTHSLVENENIQESYAKKIAELEARIKKLEAQKTTEARKTALEKLLKEAEAIAARKQTAAKQPETKICTSGQRQQQSLNPNFSVTGDFIGHFSDIDEDGHAADNHGHGGVGGKRFLLREAEFHIISNLDPYTRAKLFLGVPGGGSMHIGEAYMEWLNLPLNLGLKIGKYRTQFGVLNRWHNHGLPQVDRPRVLTQFLGEDGLSGFGVSANVLLPRLWSHVNELDAEVIYGGDGASFSSEGNRQWVALAHLKNYYDLTNNAYLELGFSGAYGHHDPAGDFRTILGGVDLTYKWVPAGRSKYRTFEFRNEFIISHREVLLQDVISFGIYSYLENRLNARWWTGIRFDYTQLPESNNEYLWGVSPHLTYRQSEFVFIRFQLSHFQKTYGKNENVIYLQSVWSMGPHKHEAY